MNVARWLTTSILHAARTSTPDAWGQPAYAAAVRRAARVEWTPAEVASGTDERATVTATVLTSVALKPGDRVWLPALDMTPPADADASDSTKARTVEQCTPGVGVSGPVAFYETRF